MNLHKSPADEKFAFTVIGAAYAIRLLRGMSSGWLGPLIPTIALLQSLSLVKTAFMWSMYMSGLFLMLIVGPFILARFGGKNSLVIATLFYALGFITIALGVGEYQLWLGALLVGFGAGLSIPCGTLCVLKLSGSTPGSALSKYAILYGVGALLGPLLAAATVNTAWSYHLVYVFGAVVALSIGAILFVQKDQIVVKDSVDKEERQRLVKEPFIWIFAVVLFFYCGLEASSAAWMFVYLKDSCKLEPAWAAFGMTALFTGLTLGRLAAVQLCKKLQPLQIILGSLTLVAFSLSLLLARPEFNLLALALVFALGLGYGPIFPNIIAAGTSKFPNSIGASTSIMMLVAVPGGIFFPWFLGIIGQSNDMHAAIAVLFTLSITIALAVIVIDNLTRLRPKRLARLHR